jgi:hypothetical protein
VRRAASIAACCSLCTPCLVYAGVHAVKSSLSRGSCLSTCSQCEVLLKILNLHITAATCGRPVMPSASGCSNMLPCTQCLQSGAQQTPSPRMLHTCTVACCLIVLASCQCGCSFLRQHMSLGHSQHCQLAHVAHYMNSTRHAAHRHTHTQTHACMLMCYCSRFRATPDESALRPCTLPSM